MPYPAAAFVQTAFDLIKSRTEHRFDRSTSNPIRTIQNNKRNDRRHCGCYYWWLSRQQRQCLLSLTAVRKVFAERKNTSNSEEIMVQQGEKGEMNLQTLTNYMVPLNRTGARQDQGIRGRPCVWDRSSKSSAAGDPRRELASMSSYDKRSKKFQRSFRLPISSCKWNAERARVTYVNGHTRHFTERWIEHAFKIYARSGYRDQLKQGVQWRPLRNINRSCYGHLQPRGKIQEADKRENPVE